MIECDMKSMKVRLHQESVYYTTVSYILEAQEHYVYDQMLVGPG